MPLIQKAADSVLEKDIIENGKHDVKEIASRYTIKAIMSSAFSIGTFTDGEVKGIHFCSLDPKDEVAMNEAEEHALNILPKNASERKYLLLGMVPEWIRHGLDYTLYPE